MEKERISKRYVLRRTACGVAIAVAAAALLTLLSPSFAGSAAGGRTSKAFCSSEGSANFGLFVGVNASFGLEGLQVLDLTGTEGQAAWPVANPVLTAAALPSFACDEMDNPHLWPTADGRLLAFFEMAACTAPRRAIGVAESRDGGASWAMVGTGPTSQSADDLRRPSLFEYQGRPYMVVDGALGPALYSADRFPLDWVFHSVLVEQPLRGVTVLEVALGRWVLVGSVPALGTAAKNAGGKVRERDALAVLTADSPLGPWEEHPQSPFSVAAASPGGGVFRIGSGLVRFGRRCGKKALSCGGAAAVSFGLTPTSLQQRPVPAPFGRRIWRQRERWDSAGQHYVTVAVLPSGRAAALAAGRSLGYSPPQAALLLSLALAMVKTGAAAAAVLVAVCTAARLPSVRRVVTRADRSGERGMLDGTPPALLLPATHCRGLGLAATLDPSVNASPRARASIVSRRPSTSAVVEALASEFHNSSDYNGVHWPTATPCSSSQVPPRLSTLAHWFLKLGELPRWRALLIAAATALAVVVAAAGHGAMAVAAPYWQPARPVAVGGQFSHFTLMVMTYEARMETLRWYVHHYSQCPSVGEILVVWNKGQPPDPVEAFPSAAVPVRVRVESTNSMNNRFAPDANLTFRAVLSLDDDIIMPCADIETAFAAWREHPRRLVGFYPRLAALTGQEALPRKRAGKAAQEEEQRPLRYHGEPAAVAKGSYNLILAGAAFIDSTAAFAAYSAPELAPARALVDELHNCDNLLMNFVVGSLAKASAVPNHEPRTVQYLRAARRADISGLSGVGISHDASHFLADANRCLEELPQYFGGVPLRAEAFDWSGSSTPRCSARNVLDCSYLT